MDGDKRRYWLIEGLDDTSFRLYREGNRTLKKIPFWSMAGTIDEIKERATLLDKDGSQAARRLSGRFMAAVPRFEATEEVHKLAICHSIPSLTHAQKRRRREYRQVQRQRFVRPEPGFSLYEGRTRGKRMRYTYDEEGDDSDDFSIRRSTRNSDRSTPADQGPTVTASGRTVRARGGGMYGESLLSGQVTNTDTPVSQDFDGSDTSEAPLNSASRATRSGRDRVGQLNGSRKRKHIDGYNDVDRMSDEDDASTSGGEWDGGDENDDDVDDNIVEDEEDDMSDMDEDEGDELNQPSSRIVKLKIGNHPHFSSSRSHAHPKAEVRATSLGAPMEESIAVSQHPQLTVPDGPAAEAPHTQPIPRIAPPPEVQPSLQQYSAVVPNKVAHPQMMSEYAAPAPQQPPIQYSHAHPPPVPAQIQQPPTMNGFGSYQHSPVPPQTNGYP